MSETRTEVDLTESEALQLARYIAFSQSTSVFDGTEMHEAKRLIVDICTQFVQSVDKK